MSLSSMRESLLLDVAGDDDFHGPLMADPQSGLSSEEANRRLQEYGIIVIADPVRKWWEMRGKWCGTMLIMYIGFCYLMQVKHPLQRLVSYFTGPMPVMIWIAVIVEILDKQWPDVVVLLILQFVNGKILWNG